MIRGSGHFHEVELALLVPFRQPGILSQQACPPFKGEPAILTSIIKLSVALKSLAADSWTPTEKQVFPPGITSGMEFEGANQLVHWGLKPANILLQWAHES
jgi:hypothetical protein